MSFAEGQLAAPQVAGLYFFLKYFYW